VAVVLLVFAAAARAVHAVELGAAGKASLLSLGLVLLLAAAAVLVRPAGDGESAPPNSG
jgi:hypothetical protein